VGVAGAGVSSAGASSVEIAGPGVAVGYGVTVGGGRIVDVGIGIASVGYRVAVGIASAGPFWQPYTSIAVPSKHSIFNHEMLFNSVPSFTSKQVSSRMITQAAGIAQLDVRKLAQKIGKTGRKQRSR
jgi:hypothetical protein